MRECRIRGGTAFFDALYPIGIEGVFAGKTLYPGKLKYPTKERKMDDETV